LSRNALAVYRGYRGIKLRFRLGEADNDGRWQHDSPGGNMTYKRIDFNKISNPKLRADWDQLRMKLEASLKKLNAIKLKDTGDPQNLLYFEAVNDFSEARDKERSFFWENFIMEQPVHK
jgi:hypothetical protein